MQATFASLNNKNPTEHWIPWSALKNPTQISHIQIQYVLFLSFSLTLAHTLHSYPCIQTIEQQSQSAGPERESIEHIRSASERSNNTPVVCCVFNFAQISLPNREAWMHSSVVSLVLLLSLSLVCIFWFWLLDAFVWVGTYVVSNCTKWIFHLAKCSVKRNFKASKQ